MKFIGYFLHDPATNYLVETGDHAARIFDSPSEASRIKASSMNSFRLVREPAEFESICKSLLEGAFFCFDEPSFDRFKRAIRNDPRFKAYLPRMGDRTRIRWTK